MRQSTQKNHLVLVQELCSDDESTRQIAWRELCHAHFNRLYGLVRSFSVEDTDVEDLVQKSMVIAFHRMGEVGEIQDLGAWLRGITVKVVLKHLRWRRLRASKNWVLSHSPAAPSVVTTPEQNVAAEQEIQSVRGVIQKLSPKLRNVLVLCDIEEMKPGEASQLLGISVETVRSRRRLAKLKFLEIWKEE